MSASAGGRTMPSESASAMATTSSAPLAWTTPAMAATSSMVPKKLGDWMRTQAVCGVMAASSASRSTRPLPVKAISAERQARDFA